MTATAYLFGGGFALMLLSLMLTRGRFVVGALGVTLFLVGGWGMYGFWPVVA